MRVRERRGVARKGIRKATKLTSAPRGRRTREGGRCYGVSPLPAPGPNVPSRPFAAQPRPIRGRGWRHPWRKDLGLSKKTVNRKEAKDKEATAMDVNSNHLSAAPSSSSSSSSSIVRHLRQAASTEEERRVARLRERLKCVVRDLLRDGRETERCYCIQYFPFPLWLFLSLSFCRCSKS